MGRVFFSSQNHFKNVQIVQDANLQCWGSQNQFPLYFPS